MLVKWTTLRTDRQTDGRTIKPQRDALQIVPTAAGSNCGRIIITSSLADADTSRTVTPAEYAHSVHLQNIRLYQFTYLLTENTADYLRYSKRQLASSQ